jgi:hypothetical protein
VVSLPDSGQRLVCNTPLLTFGAPIFTSNGHPAQADNALAPQGRERSLAAYTSRPYLLSSHCLHPCTIAYTNNDDDLVSRRQPPCAGSCPNPCLAIDDDAPTTCEAHQAPSSMPRVAINVSSLSLVESMLTLVIPARHLLATPITLELNGIRPIQTPRADRAWYRHWASPLPAQSRGTVFDAA